MRFVRRWPWVGSVLLLVLSVSASGQEPFKVQLRFISDKSEKPETGARLATSFALGSVTDARELDNPSIVGESQAKSKPRPIEVISPVSQFVETVIRASFQEWNVSLDPGAPLTLDCEVLQFQFEEVHRVVVDARLRFLLRDRAGKAVWQGDVEGDDGVWGRSLNEKNYSQAASTATKRALASLFDKTDFRRAVRQ